MRSVTMIFLSYINPEWCQWKSCTSKILEHLQKFWCLSRPILFLFLFSKAHDQKQGHGSCKVAALLGGWWRLSGSEFGLRWNPILTRIFTFNFSAAVQLKPAGKLFSIGHISCRNIHHTHNVQDEFTLTKKSGALILLFLTILKLKYTIFSRDV